MSKQNQQWMTEAVPRDVGNPATTIEVLYVEDNPEFADLCVSCLQSENDQLDITCAPDPSTGLEQLSTEVDCVVSDYNMPRMNGIEFLDAVRETYVDLPFILFTAREPTVVSSEIVESEPTLYIHKEGGIDQFTKLADRILNVVN